MVEAHLLERGLVTEGWAAPGGPLQHDMKAIIRSVIKAAQPTLARKDAYFDLFGFDLLLDDQLGLHLLEVNTNPALHLDNDVLADLLPRVVRGSLYLVMDARQGSANAATSGEPVQNGEVTEAAEAKEAVEEEAAPAGEGASAVSNDTPPPPPDQAQGGAAEGEGSAGSAGGLQRLQGWYQGDGSAAPEPVLAGVMATLQALTVTPTDQRSSSSSSDPLALGPDEATVRDTLRSFQPLIDDRIAFDWTP